MILGVKRMLVSFLNLKNRAPAVGRFHKTVSPASTAICGEMGSPAVVALQRDQPSAKRHPTP